MARLLGLALIVVSTTCAVAQTDGVLFGTGFEEDLSGFVTGDPQATLSLCKDPEVVLAGNQCLQLQFLQRSVSMPQDGAPPDGLPGMMMFPIPQPLPELKAISASIAVAHSSPIAIIVAEGEQGPRYMAVVWCEAGEWHNVTLGLDAFTRDKDGPADPDGKLTPEKITNIAMMDMGSFLRTLGEMATMFYVAPPEDQSVWLDECKLLSKAPEPAAAPAEGITFLNNYKAPLRNALFLGGKGLTVTRDEAEEGDHIRLDYTVPPRTLAAAIHMIPAEALVGAQAIRLRVKSSGTATLMLATEEKRSEDDKTNYSTMINVDGLAPWKEVTIPISDLKMDEGQTDPNGKLDLDKVDSVFIADLSGMGAAGDIKNTLWIADLVAVKAAK